jgi:hypothetical protein
MWHHPHVHFIVAGGERGIGSSQSITASSCFLFTESQRHFEASS